MAITLPVADDGDGDLTESLTGTFKLMTGDSDGDGLWMVDTASGAISLIGRHETRNDNSGLRFTNRTVGMNGAAGTAATITGIPEAAAPGTFEPVLQGGGRRPQREGEVRR